MYILKCNVVNLYMCIYVHIDTEGLMEDKLLHVLDLFLYVLNAVTLYK